MTEEIKTQPRLWQRAAELAADKAVLSALPKPGERVAVVGCGTSLFMAQAMAVLRESAGFGETDAHPASEFPFSRRYDRVVALSRSGTTTEVVRLLTTLGREVATTAITTARDLPMADRATHTISLGFADEQSVVQTRFATTALALWRASVGVDLGPAIVDATAALNEDLDSALLDCDQFTFLGSGWTVGVANEAALKLREAAQVWTESYPAMEFRHGPLSVVGERSAVWIFGPIPPDLAGDIAATGARLVHRDIDPLADLTTAQRLAAALAEQRGLNPDQPRHLTRSIILRAPA